MEKLGKIEDNCVLYAVVDSRLRANDLLQRFLRPRVPVVFAMSNCVQLGISHDDSGRDAADGFCRAKR